MFCRRRSGSTEISTKRQIAVGNPRVDDVSHARDHKEHRGEGRRERRRRTEEGGHVFVGDLRLLFQQWESSKRVRLQTVERSIEPEACNTSEYLRWTRPVYYLLNDTVRQWLVGTSRRPGSRPVLQLHVLQSTLSSYYGVFQVSITGTHLRR